MKEYLADWTNTGKGTIYRFKKNKEIKSIFSCCLSPHLFFATSNECEKSYKTICLPAFRRTKNNCSGVIPFRLEAATCLPSLPGRVKSSIFIANHYLLMAPPLEPDDSKSQNKIFFIIEKSEKIEFCN
jgi:hypothetical protein